MENIKENKEILWINNLRGIACALIVLLHVIDGWLNTNSIQLDKYSAYWWLDNVIIQVLVRIGVPIFIMITGTLLLNPKKEIKLKKIIKYIIRMLIILTTFGLFYCLIEQFMTDGLKNPMNTILVSILNLFEQKSWVIMWYIYMLIGLYAITPILKAFINNTNDETFIFVLMVLFVFSSVVPTINFIFNIKLTTFYLSGFIYIFYYLMGYFITYKITSIVNKTYIYGVRHIRSNWVFVITNSKKLLL